MSDTSSSSDTDPVEGRLMFSKRAFTRTFVHLDKRFKKAPTSKELKALKDAGRVKDLAFTKNNSVGDMENLLLLSFNSLSGVDLSW